jgi:hypothetical protein
LSFFSNFSFYFIFIFFIFFIFKKKKTTLLIKMSVSYQASINYEQKVASAPYYSYTKILQNNGGNEVKLTASASQTSQFDIPSQVYNLSKSFLRFDLIFPAIPADNTAGATFRAHKMLTKIPPIRRLSLMTRSGRMVADIPNFQHYWMLSKNLIVHKDDFANYPPTGVGQVLNQTSANATATNSATNNGVCLFNNPCYAGPTQALASALQSNGVTILQGAANEDPEREIDSIKRQPINTELQVITSTANASGAASETLALTCEFRFNKCGFSFFSVNRDFYTTEALQLWVEWEGFDSFTFNSSGLAAQAAAIAPTLRLPLSNSQPPSLVNLELYMAIEMNEGVRQSVMAKVATGGLAMTIPYTTVLMQGLGNQASASVNYKINRGHGERLLRVISAENVTETKTGDTLSGRCLFNNFDQKSNAGQNGITTVFNTQLDSKRIQIQDLDVRKADDYRFNYPKIKNTILSNIQEYYTNCPVHIDDWSACDDLTEAPEKDLQNCGLDLTAEKLWTKYIQQKPTRGTNMVTLIVTQKTLISGPEGVMI